MLKAKVKKSLSVLLSATMLASMFTSFAAVASADNNDGAADAAQVTGVQTFTEDFSSYTAETVATDKVQMLDDKAGTVAATHPSGAQWKVPQTKSARGYIDSTMAGKYWFELNSDHPEGNILKIQGMGNDYRGSLNLDTSNAFKVDEFKEFRFSTIAMSETIGTRLFVSEGENNYLEFSFAGNRNSGKEGGKVPAHRPKVIYAHSGTREILYNAGTVVDDTTQGAKDGWKDTGNPVHLNWTITINDDNSLTWTVKTTNGGDYKDGEAVSTGTIPAEIVVPLMHNYRYPLAATGDGDTQYGKYDNVSFDYTVDTTTSFVEDFSSYTAETVNTTATAVAKGDVIATHPSGSKWVVDRRSNGSHYKFDVDNDRIYLKGWGSWWDFTTVNLHKSETVKVKKYDTFKFTTHMEDEGVGVRLFVSADGKNALAFVLLGNRRGTTRTPFVEHITTGTDGTALFNSSDTVTVNGTETTRALADGWLPSNETGGNRHREANWTVKVNDDNSISWSVVSAASGLAAGAAASSGTIPAEIAAPLIENCQYPVAMYAEGDSWNNSYISNVSFSYVPDNTEEFVEDFSSYTAEDVATSDVTLAADKALLTAATHPSGAKWKVPATYNSRGEDHGKYRFDVNNNRLHIRSWGDWRRTALNLDIDNAIGVDRFEEFTFDTYSRGESIGARLFTDSAETSYLEFTITGSRTSGTEDGTYPKEMPKVVLVNNGTRTPIFNAGTAVGETTQGAMDGWKDVDQTWVRWTIKINEDNSINWHVTTIGGNYTVGQATSSGTISADIVTPLLENYRYPISVTGDGDGSSWDASWVYNVGFKYLPDKDFVAPDFHEDFTDYKADDVTVTAPFLIQNNRRVLGTHESGAKWITSNKNSYAGNSSYGGAAYIDVTNNRIATKGWGTYHLQKVLLDYSDKKYDVKKVKFTSLLGEHEAALTGLTMFVDGQNENNFLFFGQMRENTSAFGLNGATNKKYAPVIVKVVNGTATPLVYTQADAASDWNVNDKEATWTIEFDENNNVKWTVTSSRGTTASGTIENDEDVKKLISANWAYPLASIACGDNYSFIKSVDMWTTEPQELVYEKKAYTRAEFKALFDNALYGKPGDVEKLMKLDLSEVDGGTADATVTVGTSTKSVSTKLFGSHTEYSSGYTGMSDENGNITDEFKATAEKIAPITTYRIGGGGSTGKNILKDLNNEDSYYLSADMLPSHMQEKAGQLSYSHKKDDAATLINAALANNPSASFNLCISPYTTTPEEVAQLITNLTGSDSSYRLAYGLPEDPIKLESIELGNELEHFGDYENSKTFAIWYGDRMPAYISAIEGAAPSLKIIANGMTCPWLGVGSYGFWLDMIAETRTVGSDTNYRIVDHIDNISFHPYYDYGNVGTTGLLDTAGTMKSYLDTKAPGNNVKFIITEHGVGWLSNDGLFANYETSSFKAALINSAFAAEAARRDYIEPIMYNHGTYGTLWQRINNNTISPLGEVYSFLTKEWKDTTVKTDVSVDDDVVGTYSNYFTASTVKSSANEIKIILTNAADYKSVNTTFDLPANYTLVNEKVMKAPNPFTATYNENCQDLVKTTSNDVEVKNFSSYKVPASSIVVLTLQIPDGKSEFAESFDYDNAEVEASATALQVAANANGAKWMTSATNNGAVLADFDLIMDDSFGKVEIANGALKISNVAASDKATSANWDISAVSEKPSDISEISFTVTGANGGVKLFADSSENSKFDFSNKTVGLTGTVNWTIAIADGTLTWTAKNGVDTKTGTIAVSASDMTGYTYLASAYLSSGVKDSATFDDFLFRYGSAEAPALDGVTYVNNANTVDVTVNPSVYGQTSARVLVGYYNGDALVGANTAVITADGQTFNSAKPSTTYTKAVIFVWDEATQAPLADEIAVQ